MIGHTDSWWRRLAPLLFLAAGALTLLGYASSQAQEIPGLDERVTDLTGALEDTDAIEDAIADLEDDEGVQLWVLFVETTDGLPITDYVDVVADENSFGGNDALLVVALDDRTDGLWVGSLLEEVSDEEIDRLLAEELEPELADGAFEDGVIALTEGLGDAAGGSLGGDGGGEADESGGGGSGWIVLLVIVGIIVAIVVAVIVMRRLRARSAAEERDRQTGQLAKRANTLLLETDDDLKEAEQEIGFAEAQFGPETAAPFRAALATARTELQAAFAIRQELDDEKPESPEQRRKLLEALIVHGEQAQKLVSGELARIEQLRDLERNAPEVIAALGAEADRVASRLPEAEREFRALQSNAAGLWQPLDGNIVEARKRIDFAQEAAAEGSQALGSGDRNAAAAHAHDGQVALAEATELLSAITHQAEAVRTAAASVNEELAAAEADVRAAQAAMKNGAPGAEGIARAEAQLEAAREAAAGPRPDPLAAVRLAQEANAGADAVLAGIRKAEEQRQREVAAFRGTLQRADTTYRQASDYLSGKRSNIGREARTRLAEAERHLASARQLEGTDPAQGATEARTAERLAGEALRLAQRDFGGPRSQGPRGGVGGGGTDIAGAILGGVLGGMMSGRGGGFGGSSWGSSSRPRSGGGGFRMPSGGGRRSGGGGRSGGGRSRGGRW